MFLELRDATENEADGEGAVKQLPAHVVVENAGADAVAEDPRDIPDALSLRLVEDARRLAGEHEEHDDFHALLVLEARDYVANLVRGIAPLERDVHVVGSADTKLPRGGLKRDQTLTAILVIAGHEEHVVPSEVLNERRDRLGLVFVRRDGPQERLEARLVAQEARRSRVADQRDVVQAKQAGGGYSVARRGRPDHGRHAFARRWAWRLAVLRTQLLLVGGVTLETRSVPRHYTDRLGHDEVQVFVFIVEDGVAERGVGQNVVSCVDVFDFVNHRLNCDQEIDAQCSVWAGHGKHSFDDEVGFDGRRSRVCLATLRCVVNYEENDEGEGQEAKRQSF